MIYSILFSTLVPSPFVTPLRMGWWKPTWRSWHSMPCQLPRSSTVSEPTCLRDCQGMWPDTDTGEHHQSIVIQYSLFFKKTVELPPLWQILNNFFCAAHWVNWLEFRTNTINMLISFWEEFVDMEANLSFLSKTKSTWHVWDDQWWSFCKLCTYLMCHRSCFLSWLMTTTVINFSNAHSLYRLHSHLAESS